MSTLPKLVEMNTNNPRHVAWLHRVRISIGKTDGCKPRKRTTSEILEAIKHKLAEDGALFVPASALASTCGSGASQRMLSVEGISSLAKFRQMNINQLRHVAGLNGVRISLGKIDGCKPRKRKKAEILDDIKHKLVQDGPLLAPNYTRPKRKDKRPKRKDVIQQMEAEGKSRTQIRAALRLLGFHCTIRLFKTDRRPYAKDVVEQMKAEGKTRTEIRHALWLHGFHRNTINKVTKHMDGPLLGA